MNLRVARYGLIGFGRIGRRIAARLQGADVPALVAVLVRAGQAAQARLACPPDLVCTTLVEFLERRPDIAVECAGAAALAGWGAPVLAAGVDLVPLSLAALADPAIEHSLRDAATAGPGRLELAGGAVAGLDFLATAREDRLGEVIFRAAYPTARWLATPAADLVDLANVTVPTIFFRGSAREAARLFPRHLNVCVGVALAGLGLDATSVELSADPALRQARFEVEAMAAAGPILLQVGPRDVPAGADPVDHTTFSVMRLLRPSHLRYRHMSARLDAAVAARREGSVGFLRALVRAGQTGEDAVQTLVAERTSADGCTVERVRYRPDEVAMRHEFAAATGSGERMAIVARRRGRGGGRSLVLFAHPDSEAQVTAHGWAHAPFAAAIDDGRLYGWGVADDLAGVACMVEALGAVAAAGCVLGGDVIAASTPSKRHARGVCALLGRGLTADAALYLHPAESGSGMREIKAFTSGQLEFGITVAGASPPTTEPLQAAFAHRAVNPIEKAFAVHQALRALDAQRGAVSRHPALEQAIGRSTNLMLTHIACGDPQRLAQLDAQCRLGGVIAFPPPETLEDVQAQVEQAVRAAALADPWLASHPPAITWLSGTTGAELKQDHPLYRLAAAAIAHVTGGTPLVNALHTGSDIRHPMVQRDIPTIGLGPLGGDLTQNGRTDEWVDVEDYLRSIRAVAALIAGWCA